MPFSIYEMLIEHDGHNVEIRSDDVFAALYCIDCDKNVIGAETP